ncbi:hypothetical protein [Nonomuraea indica]|uniref:hypothetical protein n=1 Tax=Nonomuraea indica TaxID=1581193 RepID=UPI000C7D0F30|nr:hypothetical protein [Nonomuraea indica]
MARIKEFFRVTKSSGPHPTEVECGYQAIHTDEGVFLQLSTYGSDERQSEKKTSQTLQLDRQRAAELLYIITSTFPDLKVERA